jgi:ABC-type antimicrobial peptide transport system permease subunit
VKESALSLAGIAIGLFGTLILTRLMRTLLFEVSPTDPITFVGVSLLLLVTAMAACYIPARRAAATDPVAALRQD